jgi:hypothetical protein
MASAGTLLSDLDGSTAGAGDEDLVQRILQDMNVSSGGGGQPPPPPAMPAPTPPQYAQMPSSMMNMTMDRQIPTSHIIGNESPSPADFAAAMVGLGGQRIEPAPVGVMPGTAQAPSFAPTTATSKNFYGRVLEEAKVPFVVALLFFVFSLPPIRVLVAHYIPSLIQPTGQFHLMGLVVVSLIVGGTFWLLQRVIAPLLSL